MSILETIEGTMDRCPSAPAFLSRDGVLSYGDFRALLEAVTAEMSKHGVRAGDVVGLSMGQSPLHCAALLALARLGAVSVAVHPEFPMSTRERIVAKFGVVSLVSLDGQHSVDGVRSIRLDTLSFGSHLPGTHGNRLTPAPAAPCRISLTSGTTGIPKGDLLTHAQLDERVERTMHGWLCDETSRVMPSDIHFTMAIAVCLGVLAQGGTLVFPASSRPQDRIRALTDHAVTHAFLSQWAISQMLPLLPEHPRAFPSLQHLRPVGSQVSDALLELLQARWTPRVFVTYGLTELGPVSMATPETLANWPRSVGHRLPWVQVEVFDATGQMLPPGASGEIRVRVERGATHYHDDPQESARKFHDGWFCTGDHGRVCEDGLIFIEGRIDDMINLEGYKVSPACVEAVLMQHPQVVDAVVFVMREGDSAACLAAAVIAGAAEIDVVELSAYARTQLGWGSPKRLFVVPEFPRTPNGKVIRAEMASAVLRTLTAPSG